MIDILHTVTVTGAPLSELIGEGARLVIYRDGGEIREVEGFVVQPGQTIREAIEGLTGPGEHAEIRLVPPGPLEPGLSGGTIL